MEYGLRAILKMAVLEERLEVLILVLMEYGLRGFKNKYNDKVLGVLILVLMEYGLREDKRVLSLTSEAEVLILVLMEYGLRVRNRFIFTTITDVVS